MANKHENYGEIFKYLRQGQGYYEWEAYKEVCSRSTLCRFEIGENDISLSKFIGLLKNIDISTEEYFANVRNYEPHVNERFFQKINHYYYGRDVANLKKMLTKFHSSTIKKDKLRVLIISSLINDLDENFTIPNQDFKDASNYLIGVENWGYDELGLLLNIIDKLNINLACSITRDLIRVKKKFLINDYRKTQLIKLLLNVSYSCIQHEYIDDASIFLEEAEILIATQRIENCIAEKYCFRFMKGFFYLICGETKTGVKLMKKAVDNFKTTENEEIIKRYEQYYIEALEQAGYKD